MKMLLSRRSLLGTLLAAPLVVRATSLMPVRALSDDLLKTWIDIPLADFTAFSYLPVGGVMQFIDPTKTTSVRVREDWKLHGSFFEKLPDEPYRMTLQTWVGPQEPTSEDYAVRENWQPREYVGETAGTRSLRHGSKLAG